LKKRILLYATNKARDAILFEEALASSLAGLNIESYASIDRLTDRLIHINGAKIMAVIYASSEKDLIELYFIQHLLRRVVLVLLLPDSEHDTVAMGHRLQPSFMYTINTDVSEITEAINSIIVNGSPLQTKGQFKNPFESIMPDRATESRHNLVNAA
jgi:hypothetical protein